MDRRKFLVSAATIGAAGMLANTGFTQGVNPEDVPAGGRGGAPAGRGGAAAAPAPFTGTPQKIDFNATQLQWLRTPQTLGKAIADLTFDGASLTVGAGAAHVNADRVAIELPAYVNGLKSAGVAVNAINTSIVDADANAERILAAAAAAGVKHYTWGTYSYDLTKPIQPQLDALKSRVDRLARLNQRHGIKGLYTTSSVPGTVGSRVWDILSVLRSSDARFVGIQFDMADMIALGGNEAWAVDFLAAGPYLGGIVVADVMPYLNVQTPQGGPFTGDPAALAGRGGGRGAAAPGAPPPPPPPPPPSAKPPAKYSVTLDGRPVPTDRGGAGLKVLPWYFTYVPLGTGMLDVPRLAALIKQTGFTGPLEIQSRYPNGGSETGADRITEDRIMVLARIKRDQLALKQGFAAAGLVPNLYSLGGR